MSTQYTNQDIYRFATEGNSNDMLIALNQGNNSTNWYTNPSGYTPLHCAAINGHTKCLELLLNKGIDITAKNNLGYTSQHLASENGHLNCLLLLLDNGGVNINDNNNLFTLSALQGAAREGHKNCVEVLLDRNADIHIKSRTGMTSLHLAAKYGRFICVEYLLERGSDINSKNNNGGTALIEAANSSHKKCVEILLERGAIIDSDIEKYAPVIQADQNQINVIDCRPIIYDEVEHRRKRSIFDSFISHHIEYQPYIDSIYTLCYPTGNRKVAKPPIGWEKAEIIRDNNYFNEIFFHVHMGIAKLYSNNKPGAIKNTSMALSSDYFASNSDYVSTLMTVITDRLKMYLKPKDLQ